MDYCLRRRDVERLPGSQPVQIWGALAYRGHCRQVLRRVEERRFWRERFWEQTAQRQETRSAVVLEARDGGVAIVGAVEIAAAAAAVSADLAVIAQHCWKRDYCWRSQKALLKCWRTMSCVGQEECRWSRFAFLLNWSATVASLCWMRHRSYWREKAQAGHLQSH